MENSSIQIEIGKPRKFTFQFKLVSNLLLLLITQIPLIAILFLTFFALAVFQSIVFILVVLFLSIVMVFVELGVYFLLMPVLNGGYLYHRKVNAAFWIPPKEENRFIVQLQLDPRLIKGFEGALDDADDIGRLCIEDAGLEFFGDATHIRIPYESISSVDFWNSGWRSLWIGSKKIRISLKDGTDYRTAIFSSSEGLTFFQAKDADRRLIVMLQHQLDQWMLKTTEATPDQPLTPEKRFPLQ